MILFWNNTYYNGLSWNNNTREMFEPIPLYFYFVNYIVGFVFMSSFFIGIGLNPFVIKFNWTKKKSSVSLLFVITGCKFIFIDNLWLWLQLAVVYLYVIEISDELRENFREAEHTSLKHLLFTQI